MSSDEPQSAPRAAVRTDEPIAKEDVGRVLVDVLGPTAATDAESAVAPEALVAAARTLRFAMKCNPGVALPVRRVAAWDPGASLQIDESGLLPALRATVQIAFDYMTAATK